MKGLYKNSGLDFLLLFALKKSITTPVREKNNPPFFSPLKYCCKNNCQFLNKLSWRILYICTNIESIELSFFFYMSCIYFILSLLLAWSLYLVFIRKCLIKLPNLCYFQTYIVFMLHDYFLDN